MSLDVPFSALDIGRCSHNETCRTVLEGLARDLWGTLNVQSGQHIVLWNFQIFEDQNSSIVQGM